MWTNRASVCAAIMAARKLAPYDGKRTPATVAAISDAVAVGGRNHEGKRRALAFKRATTMR